ncbi:MazG-like family protein [Kineococcus aurantiacus]|uniref:NTP pyrophosphatase (Non-canonical NTP hydrolase) n=1 Tax=Kineococcus aurantiacus TaxID=37633 RepID=A0A7Y9DJH7_9ACTN|nr:NTP pyrophosphatase (non-canonical NTP hydrolase) [Kineococcus aurantiacus]
MTHDELQRDLESFAQARDWEQFHTPKNLVMALAGEVGELADLFQWLTPEESLTEFSVDAERRKDLEQEMADVFGYLLRLADVLNVDLEEALRTKMRVNATRYPVESSRGRATKYNKLENQ